VALLDRRIVGHGIMSVAAGECHILNLCVHPDFQGRRLGRRMLRRLLDLARRHNADTAFLEVRGSNRPAITLYASEGFGEVGIRRGYYPRAEGREDAVIMARWL
jgi:ribosomal-protein-alanine N-acetyltransferase